MQTDRQASKTYRCPWESCGFESPDVMQATAHSFAGSHHGMPVMRYACGCSPCPDCGRAACEHVTGCPNEAHGTIINGI